MKKDVQQYFIVQQKQYNEMLKLADKVNEEIAQGLVSNEQRQNFEAYFATMRSNYERIAYIYHLLCLPPKPIRVIKEYFLKKSNEKSIKEAQKAGSLEEVVAENEQALEGIKGTLNERDN